MATISLYAAKENKAGLSPLYIRYVHDRKTTLFKLSYSLPSKYVDVTAAKITKGYANREALQAMIDTVISDLKAILATTKENPTGELIQQKYQVRLVEKEQIKQQEETGKKVVRRAVVATHLLKEKLEEERLELEKRQSELEAHPFYRQLEGGMKCREQDSISYIRLLHEKYIKSKLSLNQDKRISKNTVKSYTSTLNNICQFAESKLFKLHNRTFTLACMDKGFYSLFHGWGMIPESEGGGGWNADSHFGNQIKNLKIFLRWCENEEDLTIHKHYKKWVVPKQGRTYPHFLSMSDLDILWEYSNATELVHERYRLHLLVFGCLVGLRIGEIMQKDELIIDRDDETGNEFLVAKTFKNKSETYFLLYDKRIKQILEMYNYNLRLVSTQKWNEGIKVTLKKVFDMHNIHQEIHTVYTYRNGEKVILKQATTAELYTSHDNRRNAISMMVQVFGWSEEDVAGMLGSRDVKTLRKYVKTNNNLKKKRFSRLKIPVSK